MRGKMFRRRGRRGGGIPAAVPQRVPHRLSACPRASPVREEPLRRRKGARSSTEKPSSVLFGGCSPEHRGLPGIRLRRSSARTWTANKYRPVPGGHLPHRGLVPLFGGSDEKHPRTAPGSPGRSDCVPARLSAGPRRPTRCCVLRRNGGGAPAARGRGLPRAARRKTARTAPCRA